MRRELLLSFSHYVGKLSRIQQRALTRQSSWIVATNRKSLPPREWERFFLPLRTVNQKSTICGRGDIVPNVPNVPIFPSQPISYLLRLPRQLCSLLRGRRAQNGDATAVSEEEEEEGSRSYRADKTGGMRV